MSEGGDRAFVLGLDGVPWPLIEPWIEGGDLPAFAELVEKGASGPLRSTTPANTPVAWPSIATGTWPDRHGLYEFMKLDADYSQRPYNREDLRQPPLWDLLSPAVVANVPMTYPAGGVGEDGTMVAGMMTPAPDADGFTQPPELGDEIVDRIPGYRVGLKWHRYGDDRRDEFLEDFAALFEGRRELLRSLMEREDWRLFFFTFTAPDRLQHLIWDEDVISDHYRDLDAVLSEVMAYCDRLGATLYVVSDHGFGPISRIVNVNRALADAGLLTPKESSGVRAALSRTGVTKARVLGALERVGIDDETLVERLPASVVDGVARTVPGDHALYDVDFARTKAFLHGLGSVYVNDTARFDDGAVDPADRDRIKAEVMEALSTLTDPATGDAVLSVHDGDDLNPEDEFAPDVVVEGVEGYHVKPGLGDDAVVDAEGIAAYHRPEGVFFARGPSIAAGTAIEGATVVDVAPTLLHGLGEPVPAAAQGQVLTEVFESGSSPATRDVSRQDHGSSTEATRGLESDEAVEERLRGLGYL
ncbi:alkaline phosphatase family protein [Halorubrum cibi]|uniref:Predicted phosphohydrolase or phosphomutase, AlkP superfamily n=1 Tax=Halorubrum cibi TaxID=413815 RepID=A0A521C2W1_9EURY|nr:alkaline phosphatase family protein [Halorubrum cibi]SMO53817.1 Predicted phosphohydrolase or phosphomutase, AlkP superfamily [Halorubrum cibi]